MEEADKSNPPEHVLKGLRRLRYTSPEDSLPHVQMEIQRWWWEFLRLSRDYWLVCQTSQRHRPETLDAKLARIYRRFGDIHSCTFEEWWLERGTSVFREREKFPKVVEVPRNPRQRHDFKMLDDHIWVDIPLKLSRRTIQKYISTILKGYESQRLDNRLELSSSDFKINPVRYRLHTLQTMHEVFSFHHELIDKPRELKLLGKWNEAHQRRADLFRIGKLLRISPSNEDLRGETEVIYKRQNRMRASVGRILSRANLLIANVEQGVFPSFKPLTESASKRFTTKQLEMHKEFEADWWQLDLCSKLSAGKLDDARRIHYQEEPRGRKRSQERY